MPPTISVVEMDTDHIDDYFALFDSAFADNPRWDGCYCAYYDDPCLGDEWDPAVDAQRHRTDRGDRLRSGAARGLLAHVEGTAVGWCNVAPRSSFPNLREFELAIEDPADDPALIMCFVIHPDHRGAGVASALVRGAVSCAGRWGAPWLEAYPRRPDLAPASMPWSAAFYKGPLTMYLNAGFTIVRDVGSWHVVRHALA